MSSPALCGVVEVIDKDFLQRNLGENDGYLYDASGRSLTAER